MREPMYVLGGAQSDVARNWSRASDEPLRDMLAEAVRDVVDVHRAPVGERYEQVICARRATG